MRAIRGLRGLRDPERFRSWLVAIAYRPDPAAPARPPAARLRRQPSRYDVPDPAGDFADAHRGRAGLTGQRRELVEAARWLDDGDRRLLGAVVAGGER